MALKTVHITDPHEVNILSIMLRHKRFAMQMLLKHYPLTTYLLDNTLAEVDTKMHIAFALNKKHNLSFETVKEYSSLFNLTIFPIRNYSGTFFRIYLNWFFTKTSQRGNIEQLILRIDQTLHANKIFPWNEPILRLALQNHTFLDLLKQFRLKSVRLPLEIAREHKLNDYVERLMDESNYGEDIKDDTHDKKNNYYKYSESKYKYADEYINSINENDIDWKSLSNERSSNFWSFNIIKKYEDKWDWEILAQNTAIHWDYELLTCFKHHFLTNPLSWHYLSKNESVQWDEFTIEEFIDKISWGDFNDEESEDYGYYGGLTDNLRIHWDINSIKRFENHLCWDSLSLHPNLEWNFELLETFEKKWNWVALERNDAIIWTQIFERYINEEKVKWFFDIYLEDEVNLKYTKKYEVDSGPLSPYAGPDFENYRGTKMSRINFDESEDRKAQKILDYYMIKKKNKI